MTNVNLLLTGRQRGDDGEESVTQTAVTAQFGRPAAETAAAEPSGTDSGSGRKHNPGITQSCYILYDEILEDHMVCKNIIKLQGSTLELTKRGGGTHPATRMVFEPGKIHNVNYSTPYGCLQMEVSTHRVEVFFEQELPQILAEYTLTSGGRLISHCLLEVKLAPLKTFPQKS